MRHTRECAFGESGAGCSPSTHAGKVTVHETRRVAKVPKVDRVDDESAEGGETSQVGSEGFENRLWKCNKGC
jgi:hypothetical protein